MNDLNESGFRSKAAALLNNESFSDVEIRVNDGTNTRSFPAHSLFLSMNSKKFANTFHGYSPPPKVFNIFDYKPKIVYMMLEYLYTEKVNFSDTDEARELHTLSKTFEIRNLQELCGDYITRNEINNENVLNIYECAYEHKYSKSLDLCRRIVSLNTKAIIESPSFVKVSLAVLEDILKQDALTVESELDIINAVIKWACHQCNRQDLADTKYLRDCIFPLLCQIRFLNLEYEQFSEIEKYSIFTVQESSLIKRKLLQPDEFVHLPPHICHLTKPRMYSTVINSELNLLSVNPSLSSTVPQNINAASERFKKAPVSKVYPQRNVSVRKAFNFSLVEAEKLVSTAFKNDVKCSMSIHLLKGMIIVHGIELTISQSRKTGELINIFLHTSNSKENLPGMSDTFTEELKDNMLSIMFDQPMKILENSHAEIEVTVEDLKLNRCCILKDPVCKLHCSDTVGDITLTSNQTNDSGDHFFLISCLIYSLV